MIKFLVSAVTAFCLSDGIAMLVSNKDWKQIAVAVLLIAGGVVGLEARFKLHDKG